MPSMSSVARGGTSTHADLTPLENEAVDHFFVLQPGYAVFLGLHRYDGLVPDFDRSATDRWVAGADKILARLRQLGDDGLDPSRRLDRFLLELLLDGTLFDLRESNDLERNPMAYVGPVSLTPYLVREYAPLAPRVDAMVRTLEAVPRLLEQGRHRLGAALPKPFVQLAISMAGGLPSHFAEAEAFARRGSASLGDRVASARSAAEGAVRDFVGRLESEYLPRAHDDFALGPERFQRLLWVREGIRTPFDAIRRQGEEDLRRNQARLDEIARASRPAASVDALLEPLYRDHPAADGLLAEARARVDETLAFVRGHDLVSVPDPAMVRVEETPSYGRALSTASMNPPGPYDLSGDEGIYYVTPVDPAWPAERQEEWLRSLNRTMLRNITFHEVYPGHYLQFLHFRHTSGSTARKVYLSSSFTEGWAHYCEQLAVEAGVGGGAPDAEAVQLLDALLRDCRLLASIGLHTGGMTVAQATELFVREAHFERLPAEREAIRGTFNPEYFCYTLGKLAILEARAKLLTSRYGGSLRRFHDRLLSFGCPPVGVLGDLLAAE